MKKPQLNNDPTFNSALTHWPEMGQQVTFIGLKHCPTKFQIYWNGAISCFIGRDCFGNIFPTQKKYVEQEQDDQLHLTFGYGSTPTFHIADTGQVSQTLMNNYLPIIITSWDDAKFRYEITVFATALNPEQIDSIPEQTLLLARVTIERLNFCPASAAGKRGSILKDFNPPLKWGRSNPAQLWLNFSGYKCLIWPKELPEDKFPIYPRKLFLKKNFIYDGNNQIRARIVAENDARLTFYERYPREQITSPELELADQKGLLTNLLGLELSLGNRKTTSVILSLPYFPIAPKDESFLNRELDSEFEKIIAYWEKEYASDTKIITPEPLVNDFYKSGLHHIYITTDADKITGTVYAKSSPAWYETIWANLAIATAVGLDYRGHHQEAEQYLEPFLFWQSIVSPPNMEGASKEGFFAPPKEYSAIPWVSNHGWTLWGLAEHYRITRDKLWLHRITSQLIAGCNWIIRERNRTKTILPSGEKSAGYGLLPAGTVSDDKGSGQYLCTDAHCYRGLRVCADILQEIGHPEAKRLNNETNEYLQAIQEAINRAVLKTEKVRLENGTLIPYVPNEIHQIKPPDFSPADFWPYINYVDAGPMHLVDAEVLDPNSALVDWILRFEEKYTVANLANEISVNENWCFSIQQPGNVPVHILRNGISVIEPFYAPHATAYFYRDEIEKYLEIFYNQLAAAISHRTLTPIENRFGVWNLPWADAEYCKMLRRMLVQEKGSELFLLHALPRLWLSQGKTIRVQNLPTYFGSISFTVSSEIDHNKIRMNLNPPLRNKPETIYIRFRHPDNQEIKRVLVNKIVWEQFESNKIILKTLREKAIDLEIQY
jgi:hypothetical protein